MKTKIKFINPGILTTLQDYGRVSLQDIGISKGGAANPSLMEIGNALVENKDVWSFEFILSGPTIEILSSSTSISITGNVDFHLIRSGKKEIGSCYRTYILKEKDQIIINRTIDSVYGYISFSGNIDLDKVFESLSCNPRSKIGPRDGQKIRENEIFEISSSMTDQEFKLDRIPENKNKNKVRLLEGPQFHFFENKSVKRFFSTPYEITTTSDKMGMRLMGCKIENQLTANIKSEAIIKGAIQVPADGQPIILLTDHQTIGGYPKIAVVASADFENLIQLPPKSKIEFKKINLREAKISYMLKQETIKNIIKSKVKI